MNIPSSAKLIEIVTEWSAQSSNLFNAMLLISLLIYAAYAEKIPPAWRWQLSSPIGRLLLLLLLVIIFNSCGFIPAVLFAIATALTWSNRPLFKPAPISTDSDSFADSDSDSDDDISQIEEASNPEANPPAEQSDERNKKVEGFEGGGVLTTRVSKHKWFIEDVLNENPVRIVQDRVFTIPVQD